MAEQKVKPAAKAITTVKAAVNSAKAAPAAAKPEKIQAVKKTAAPASKTAAPAAHTPAARKVSPEEHYRMVQTAAYFIAERSGFGGNSSDYWAAAELEIANMLR